MWDPSIATYNQQTTESRIQIVFPDIFNRLQKQKPSRLLDFGCGAGFFLRDFSSRLNIEQVGYDISDEMLKAAADNCKTTAHTSIVSDLKNYPPGYFDAITTTAVWMCWKTDEACLENLNEMHRLLKPAGKLYTVVTHPAFHNEAYSTFSLHLDPTKYLEAGTPYEVNIHDQGKSIQFTDYHWPLTAMYSQLNRTGFGVEDFYEYPDTTPTTKGSPWLLLVAQSQ